MSPEAPVVLFIDRSLGSKIVPTALRQDGHTVEIHDQHFPDPTTPDVVWLAEAGRRGWGVLSKDPAIRRTEHERQALVDAKVRAFFLARQDLTGEEMIGAFRTAMPQVLSLAAAHVGAALIATIFRDGSTRIDLPQQEGE